MEDFDRLFEAHQVPDILQNLICIVTVHAVDLITRRERDTTDRSTQSPFEFRRLWLVDEMTFQDGDGIVESQIDFCQVKELRFKGMLDCRGDAIEGIEWDYAIGEDGLHADFGVVFRFGWGVGEVKPFFVIVGDGGGCALLLWEGGSGEFLTDESHLR